MSALQELAIDLEAERTIDFDDDGAAPLQHPADQRKFQHMVTTDKVHVTALGHHHDAIAPGLVFGGKNDRLVFRRRAPDFDLDATDKPHQQNGQAAIGAQPVR